MKRQGARERTVFLIGFMASGKSAVGRKLASASGRPFVDTDREIERAARRSVSQIFAAGGEARFRALEARAVAAAAKTRRGVVAVGGGAVLRPASVARMRGAGVVVYIAVPAVRLWARAKAAGLHRRPLLASPDDAAARAKMLRLLKARRPIYRRAAHVVVRGDAPADEVAARIARRLRL